MSINRFYLMGNVEKIFPNKTKQGKDFMFLSVSTDAKKRDGTPVKNYFSCSYFGEDALAMSQNLVTNDKIMVEGALRNQKKDGIGGEKPTWSLGLNAYTITFLARAQGSDSVTKPIMNAVQKMNEQIRTNNTTQNHTQQSIPMPDAEMPFWYST